jgi:KipI family sensor histidine kinase inhibitor
MKISPLGDTAVLVEVATQSGDSLAAERVRRLVRAIEQAPSVGITDIVPSYDTVAVFYDPAKLVTEESEGLPHVRLKRWLENVAWREDKAADERESAETRVIPVCYGGEFGPDLDDVARRADIAADEVVRLHSEAIYEVRAIGFSPGFPYLAGLPELLHTPRRATPRALVLPGSVGIGGAQTGIYPLATPGGWNVIGRTPRRLFRPESANPALLRVGDRVRFEAIKPDEFGRWRD